MNITNWPTSRIIFPISPNKKKYYFWELSDIFKCEPCMKTFTANEYMAHSLFIQRTERTPCRLPFVLQGILKSPYCLWFPLFYQTFHGCFNKLFWKKFFNSTQEGSLTVKLSLTIHKRVPWQWSFLHVHQGMIFLMFAIEILKLILNITKLFCLFLIILGDHFFSSFSGQKKMGGPKKMFSSSKGACGAQPYDPCK